MPTGLVGEVEKLGQRFRFRSKEFQLLPATSDHVLAVMTEPDSALKNSQRDFIKARLRTLGYLIMPSRRHTPKIGPAMAVSPKSHIKPKEYHAFENRRREAAYAPQQGNPLLINGLGAVR
ncbi:hypothetical protein GKC30_00110 [Pseudodesulfovibrio sp. F-1]|uniref:Uncharacterized protein n=1 Tax=Pseudodesulfovibrio alkaliphilus TaxID=2661613 RepID=A0A7K1KJ03_9BACT|nr:hypothetical protein [Pseudodesulfovibrio alkaliphilus]MUM76034.1 hypothetical protein [Pseudodesulfovibrio alkaliphilus]